MEEHRVSCEASEIGGRLSFGGGRAWEVVELGRWSSLGGGRAWEAVELGRRSRSGYRVRVRVSTSRSFMAAVDWLVEKERGSCENTRQATCHNAKKVCRLRCKLKHLCE